jgi:pyrroloquinoline quinone (PQQ) biosynthesis protein C
MDIDHPWILRRVSERDRRDWIEMTYIARTADSPLAALKAMSRMQDLLDAYLEAAVAEARERGASWGDVGEALGRSRQAVHKQYGQD